MTDIERLEDRLSAVERTVVDGDHDFEDLAQLAALSEDLDRIDDRIDDFEQRLAELEGQTEAIGGFVNSINAANQDVEQQADAAIAAVDRLEDRIESLEQQLDEATGEGQSGVPADADPGRPTAEHGDSGSRKQPGDSDASTGGSMIDDGTAEQTVDGMIPDDQSGSSTLSNSSRTTAEASWSGESSAGQGSPASDSRDGRSHERTQAGAKAQDQRITSGESADRRSGAHHEGTGRRNGSSEQQVQDPRTAQPTTQASPEGRQRPGANDADQKTIEETIGRRDGQQASAETGPDEDQSDSKSTGVLDSLRSLFS